MIGKCSIRTTTKSSHAVILAFILVLISNTYGGAQISGNPNEHTAVLANSTTAPYGYFEYLPIDYNHNQSQGFPLVVFLHGLGEIGDGNNDLTDLTTVSLTKNIKNGLQSPAIILSPQSSGWWQVDKIDEFVTYALANYNIDPDRIYMTGSSMGGGGTWNYAAKYGAKLAAIVPVCGASAPQKVFNLASLPVWAFHNNGDPVVDVFNTENWINEITAAGGNPLSTIYNDSRHDAWSATYTDQSMWDWLFLQSRDGSGISLNNISVSPSVVVNYKATQVEFTAEIGNTHHKLTEVTIDLSPIGGPHDAIMTTSDSITYQYIYQIPSGLSLGEKTLTIAANTAENGQKISLTHIIVSNKNLDFYINFNNQDDIAAPWNNLRESTVHGESYFFKTIFDDQGRDHGITLTTEVPFSGVNNLGADTGNDLGVFPDKVVDGFFFTENVTAKLKLKGLDPDLLYKFIFFGSSTYNNRGDNGYTRYIIGHKMDSLYVQDNIHSTASVNSISTIDGTVTLEVTAGANAPFGYLNGMVIQVYDEGMLPEKPENVVVGNKKPNSISLSWIDNIPNETGFEIYRSDSTDNNFKLINTTATDENFYKDQNLKPFTKYFYKLRAVNAFGQSPFTETITTTTPAYSIKINFSRIYDDADLWNNTSGVPEIGSNFIDLLDHKGDKTDIAMHFETDWGGVQDDGAITGDNSGIYEDEVMREYYYFGLEAENNPNNVEISFSNLDTSYKYDFKFFGSSIWRGVPNNGHTIYSINDKKDSLYVQGNVLNFSLITQMQADSDGAVLAKITKGSDAQAGYLNAMVIDVFPPEGGSPPNAPTNLTHTLVDQKAQLTWSDVSNDEIKFEIYRSIDSLNYDLIAELKKDATYFYDTTALIGDVVYTYKIKVLNYYGSSTSFFSSFIADNNPPEVILADRLFVKDGQTQTITINTFDVENDSITLSIDDFPDFLTLIDNGDGTGNLSISPDFENIGSYTFNIIANDTQSSTQKTIILEVTDVRFTSVKINFSKDYNQEVPWNNTAKEPSKDDVYGGFVNDLNQPSDINITLLTDIGDAIANGATTGDNGGIVPDKVMKEYYYFGKFGSPDTVRFLIKGLNTSKRYSLKFFGSSVWTGVPNNGSTRYKVGDISEALYAQGNTNNLAVLSGIKSDINGELIVEMTKELGTAVGYINSIIIEAFDDDGSVMEPTKQEVMLDNTTDARLSWADNSFNEEGFEIYRADNYAPEDFELLTVTPSNVTEFIDTSVKPYRSYIYKIRAINTGSQSKFTNLCYLNIPAYSIFINFSRSFLADEPWNNTQKDPVGNDVFTGLLDSKGQNHGIKMILQSTWGGRYRDGAISGNNSGIVPDNVSREYYFFGYNGGDDQVSIKFTGLNPGQRYSFKFFASSVWRNVPDNGRTIFEIDDKSATLAVQGNLNKLAIIEEVTSNSNGELVVTLRKDENTAVGYINAMIIESLDYDPPVNFELQSLYNGNITAMKWRTTQPHGTNDGDYEGIYLFDYDRKYQLKEAVWGEENSSFEITTLSNKYRVTELNYDANGNIKSLKRFDENPRIVNDFEYTYNNDVTRQQNNQLTGINGYANYHYNGLGQLEEEIREDGKNKYVTYDVTGKVSAVYVNENKTEVKVSYTYDDRGFRLMSRNEETGTETWYIRDASGNVMSIYEKKDDGGELVQTEVPVYGSGKVGVYYPQQDGSTAYELTDHLGNVRAVVKRNRISFTATIEDTGEQAYTNPRVEEMQYFNNLFTTEMTNLQEGLNHTKSINAENAAYLTGRGDRIIGPAITIAVNSGDRVDLTAFAKFEEQAVYAAPLALADIVSALTGTYIGVNGQETAAALDEVFSSALSGFANGDDNTNPQAYLNYIYFDNDFEVINKYKERIGEDAGFATGTDPIDTEWNKFENQIEMNQNGYLYVYVSNHTPDSKVYFDDINITLTQKIVTQATDYYPFGSVARRASTPNAYFEANGIETEGEDFGKYYRYGYQGEFAEEDSETGWNSFELRMYDAVIGRWLIPDPYRQHWSPYLAMGNNPVNLVDIDGGMDGPNDPPDCGGCTILDEVVITGERTWWDNVVNFWDALDFVAEGNARVDVGLRAKVNGSFWGLKSNFDVNVVNVNLLNGAGDFTDPLNADSWGLDYAGKDGVELTNSIEAGVYLPLGGKDRNQVGIGVYAEQHQRVHGAGRSEGYGNSYGVNALFKSYGGKSIDNFPGRTPYAGGKVGKSKNFYGIDVGAGAQLILGADVSVKLGFRH